MCAHAGERTWPLPHTQPGPELSTREDPAAASSRGGCQLPGYRYTAPLDRCGFAFCKQPGLVSAAKVLLLERKPGCALGGLSVGSAQRSAAEPSRAPPHPVLPLPFSPAGTWTPPGQDTWQELHCLLSSPPQGRCGESSQARGDCEGLCWNLAVRSLGAQPHAGSYSAAGSPPALEVSLSRALNGSTKLITSFSAFLKEPKRRRCKRAEGAPYPGDRMGQAGKGADHTNPGSPGSRKPALGTGVVVDLFRPGLRRAGP